MKKETNTLYDQDKLVLVQIGMKFYKLVKYTEIDEMSELKGILEKYRCKLLREEEQESQDAQELNEAFDATERWLRWIKKSKSKEFQNFVRQ